MNRNEMKQILQAIKDGKLSSECLQPPKYYLFTKRADNPEEYEMKGKIYNEDQFNAIKRGVDSANQKLLSAPDDLMKYLNKSWVAVITLPENSRPVATSEAEVYELILKEEALVNKL